PLGSGEQRLNAEPVLGAGGGLSVDNAELSAQWIAEHLIPVLTHPDRVVAMPEAAASMRRRDADMELAREVMAIARGERQSEMPAVPDSDDEDGAYPDDGTDAR